MTLCDVAYGALIAQYVAFLISCAWSRSKAFTLREAASNALLGADVCGLQAKWSPLVQVFSHCADGSDHDGPCSSWDCHIQTLRKGLVATYLRGTCTTNRQ